MKRPKARTINRPLREPREYSGQWHEKHCISTASTNRLRHDGSSALARSSAKE